MYNRDYVTPQATRDSILLLNDSMFVPVDPARYFTDGTQRKAFTKAFQPRLGLSYALDQERRTNIFAGVGIFYDRIGFNSFVDETYRAQHPNLIFNFSADGSVPGTIAWDPAFFSRQGLQAAIASGVVPRQEIFLVPNDLRPPKSYQFSGGVRQQFGSVFTSVTYTGVRGRNGFTFEWGQLTLNPATNDCCISITTPYQNILVGNNTVRTWYDGVEFKVDRPYRRSSEDYGWGAGISYSLAWADQEGGDLFSFPQIAAGFNPRHPIGDDQRHRVVANFTTDLPFAFGIQFSGLIQVASGKALQHRQLRGRHRDSANSAGNRARSYLQKRGPAAAEGFPQLRRHPPGDHGRPLQRVQLAEPGQLRRHLYQERRHPKSELWDRDCGRQRPPTFPARLPVRLLTSTPVAGLRSGRRVDSAADRRSVTPRSGPPAMGGPCGGVCIGL